MPSNQLTELRNQIKDSIRRNSDGGFVPYNECLRVCADMMLIIQTQEVEGYQRQNFDIYIMVLLEAAKLFFYADASSGAATDVIQACLTKIDNLCKKNIDEDIQKYFFSSIIKSVKIKAFRVWPDYGYKLLRYAVYFVHDQKQAQTIYDVFQKLGTMFDGKDYPEKLLITHSIIERLKGKEAANKYLMENIHLPELRTIAVENLIADENYLEAEKHCLEVLKENSGSYFDKFAPWAYYLKRIFTETENKEKLTEINKFIDFHKRYSARPEAIDLT